MTTKMQRLEDDFNARTAKAAEIKGWIADLEKKKTDLEAEQKAAARSGNFEKFRALKEKETDTVLDLYVKQAMLEKTEEPINRADAREAWNEYSKEMQKKLEAANAELLKQRAQLAKAYAAKMDLYVEVCRQRRRMGEYIGLKNVPLVQIEQADKYGQFGFPAIMLHDIAADQAYMRTSGIIDESKTILYAAAATNHIVDPA